MNAFEFLDISFQKSTVKNGEKYALGTDGEAKAAYMILGWLRLYYKWIAVPKIFASFLMVKCGFSPEPISPLIPREVPKEPLPPKTKLAEVPPQTGSAVNGQDTPPTSA